MSAIKLKEIVKTVVVGLLTVSLTCLCATYMFLYQQSDSAAFSREDYLKIKRENTQYSYSEHYRSSFVIPETIVFSSEGAGKYLLCAEAGTSAAAEGISGEYFPGLFGEASVPQSLTPDEGRALFSHLCAADTYIYMKYHTELPRSVIYKLSDISRMSEEIGSEGIYELFIFFCAPYLSITPEQIGLDLLGTYLCAATRDLSGNYRLYSFAFEPVPGEESAFNKKIFSAYSDYEKITDFNFLICTDLPSGMGISQERNIGTVLVFRSGLPLSRMKRYSGYENLLAEENTEKLLRAFSMNAGKISYHTDENGTYTYYEEGKTFSIAADGECFFSVTSPEYAASLAMSGADAEPLDYIGATASFLASLPLFSDNTVMPNVSLTLSEVTVGKGYARISYGFIYNNTPVIINGRNVAASFEIYDGAITECRLEFITLSGWGEAITLSENRLDIMTMLLFEKGDFDISAAYAFDDENIAAGIWFSRFGKGEEDGK